MQKEFRMPIFKEGKFRDWHYWGFMTDEFGYPEFVSPHHDYRHYPSMSFTGLLDIHHKKIYEGDIVEFKGHKKVVVWDNVHLCFIMVWAIHYKLNAKYYNGNLIDKGRYTFDKITSTKKVVCVGNIYENPELIQN